MSGDLESNINHASDVTDFALLVQKICALIKSPSDGAPIRLQMTIHTGPVAAGLIGNLMPKYYIFSNNVSYTNRMKSSSDAFYIQCSNETAKLLTIKGYHIIEPRGNFVVEGLGEREVYWIKGFTEHYHDSVSFDVLDILKKCETLLDNFQTSDVGNYSYLKDKQDLVTIKNDVILTKESISLLNLETASSAISNQSALRGLEIMTISDCKEIRLATLHFLRNVFSIDSYIVCTDAEEAITKLKFYNRNFDIVVIEMNFFNTFEEEMKCEIMSLLQSRERVKVIIKPDCMFDDNKDDDRYISIAYPFPSKELFKSLLLNSKNPNTVKICSRLYVEPYIMSDTVFRIIMVDSSKSSAKIIKRQLSAAFKEMHIPFITSIATNGQDALDKCNDTYKVDLIVVDNALPGIIIIIIIIMITIINIIIVIKIIIIIIIITSGI